MIVKIASSRMDETVKILFFFQFILFYRIV